MLASTLSQSTRLDLDVELKEAIAPAAVTRSVFNFGVDDLSYQYKWEN